MVKVVQFTGQQERLVRTNEDDDSSFSFLKIVDRVDNFPQDYAANKQFQKNVYYLMTHTGIKIGFVLRFVVHEMKTICSHLFENTFEIDTTAQALKFRAQEFDDRNNELDKIAKELYNHSDLEGIKGWRNEKYAVWDDKGPYILLERAMAGLLGIITYGAHINGYVLDEQSKQINFWIARRAATKPTWPLMLDNIIAGGIGYPYGIYETAIKESMEEANLSQSIIEASIKAAGVVSYLYYQGDIEKEKFDQESSFIVGEVEYIYDLKLPFGVIPTPNDGEVDSFNLLTLQETIDALLNDEFKPNCALIMVDFLIRHGYINVDNEPNYLQLSARIHRMLPFPTLN